ncbi:MAG: outer membrane protein assembly factor [Pseudopedobacter saltans]|uniref:Outer membrane protein assembly factor n=1 Tax=Pseudopedobacter saltans TaxID=151895 RepID=A0A2W5HFC6_9SPHI|nr:MAG: outer membrane protein assembly factor [Pseudopedobacter saltans]
MHKSYKIVLLGVVICLLNSSIMAQITNPGDSANKTVNSLDADLLNIFNQSTSKQYKIAGIAVTGNDYYDSSLIISVSGLSIGDVIKIPGADNISRTINKLWSLEAFSDISIFYTKLEGDNIWLEIHVVERPRLTHLYFKGVPKSQADEIKGRSGLVLGRVVTEAKKMGAVSAIRRYYDEKGFRNLHVKIQEIKDTSYLGQNGETLTFTIDKGVKVRINDIFFVGNEKVESNKLKSQMKGTKEMMRLTLFPAKDTPVWGINNRYPFSQYLKDRGPLRPDLTLKVLDPYFRFKLFNGAKFDAKKYDDDKGKVIDYYNKIGYRDASILKDTTYYNSKGNMNIALKVNEGRKYYFGDITWRGNTLFSDSLLTEILGIEKGDVFNQDLLNTKLGITMNPEIADISGLYMDRGYLFFHATPTEVGVTKDTINFEIRLQEGPQATIKYVKIGGNDKTNEHVARRELYTLPGDKFSRDNLIRSNRTLANLGFFDQEKIDPGVQTNQEDGTVDFHWTVQEKSADQLELSAGFGGGIGLTGTLGLTFANFSTHNIFKKDAWAPLPTGDGQKLSLRFQSNGKMYRSYNLSFTEPWLGGKKRNGLQFSIYDTKYNNGYNYYTGKFEETSGNPWFRTTGVSIGLSKQLNWPDNYFSLTTAINYTRYQLHNYTIDYYNMPDFNNGTSNNLNLKLTLQRYNIDNPIFPRSGSNFMLSAQLTPPYSILDPKIVNYSDARKYKWIEYHKWRFTGEWYVPLTAPVGEDKKQLVLKMSAKFGYMGKYNTNPNLLVSPFERFQVGDAGLSNTYSFLGYDIISQRGYPVYSSSNPRVNPDQQQAATYFTMFNKYTTELRYPLSLNPSSTIFGLAFFEAANGWYGFKDYNPFQLRRSVGLGMRFNLPMFGLLGFDYGIGLDRTTPGNGIKGAGRFTFMLGFEPD